MIVPALFVGFAATASPPAAISPDCRTALLGAARDTDVRPVAPRDLVTLRDFGGQEASVSGEAPFALAPDGRKAALILRRGDPELDAYCMGLVVIALDGAAPARLVDVGGQVILEKSDVRGISDLPVGNVQPVTPRWSPDGQRLAYLRRDGGRTRAWVASADGSEARAVSRPGIDVRGVRWSADGRTLVILTRPGVPAAEAAIDTEGRAGWLYDGRFWSLSHARPSATAALPEVEQQISPSDGSMVGAEAGTSAEGPAKLEGAILYSRSAAGPVAWTAADDPAVVLGPATLRVRNEGRTITCTWTLCAGVGASWWAKDGELEFVKPPGSENGGTTIIAGWRPGSGAPPRVILRTTDAMLGCQPAAAAIICARESATAPRTLVSVDVRRSRVRTLYDPNPEFAALQKGEVLRLRWRAPDGVPSYGDLVLPPGSPAGARHPLIVVQYRSRGFLRGGTGDEYPVHALASRGFAVLSVERTPFVAAGKARGSAEFMRMTVANFAERSRVLSSLLSGVRAAIARGVVDPARIGITGMSDGAATVQYALVNSDLFRAAAISSCCDEPGSILAADRGYSDMLIGAGFPEPGSEGRSFWARYSLAANAYRLRTPILMQLPEDEFRFGLETFVTLDRHKVPVEMYVYPDGYHQKWRPAQRLSTYQRAIDWFDFWLNGKEDPDPTKAAQYARWRGLRSRQPS